MLNVYLSSACVDDGGWTTCLKEESRMVLEGPGATVTRCHWPLLEYWVPAEKYPMCRTVEEAQGMVKAIPNGVIWKARNR